MNGSVVNRAGSIARRPMIPMNTPVSGGTGSVGLGRSNAIFRAPMNNMQSPVAPSPALANQPRMGVM